MAEAISTFRSFFAILFLNKNESTRVQQNIVFLYEKRCTDSIVRFQRWRTYFIRHTIKWKIHEHKLLSSELYQHNDDNEHFKQTF